MINDIYVVFREISAENHYCGGHCPFFCRHSMMRVAVLEPIP